MAPINLSIKTTTNKSKNKKRYGKKNMKHSTKNKSNIVIFSFFSSSFSLL